MTFDPSVGPPEPELLETPTRPVNAEPLPPRKRWGCGVWALIGAAVLFFGTTVLLLLLMVLGYLSSQGEVSGAAAGPSYLRLVEHTVQGQGDNKILLVSITGIIGETQDEGIFASGPGLVQSVKDVLSAARADGNVSGVLLSIDSPGGGITASDIIRRELVAFRDETGLPVVALFGDVAASGGYYVATGADYIVAHPTTVTGSIGVIMPLFGATDLLRKIGLEARPIKSGEMKDAGAFYRDLTPEARAYLQNIVDEYFNRFVDLVFDGMKLRGVRITRPELLKYCDGRVLTGAQAKEIGFVDAVGYAEDAFAEVCKRAGVPPDQTRLIMYQHKPGLLELILARSNTPPVKGVTIDLGSLQGKETPRFMYLWAVGD
jgi:protease-4